jgi:hypothetical protein
VRIAPCILLSLLLPSAIAEAQSSAEAQETEAEAEPEPELLFPKLASALGGVKATGFAQVDYLRLERSLDELSDGNREPLNENRFLVRHARLRLSRDWQHIGLTSLTEFFSNDKGLRQVAFDIHAGLPGLKAEDPPLVQLQAGLIAVPFGFESYEQGDGERFFGERTLFAFGYVPGRFDVGAALRGHIANVDWIVAAQNGEPLESGDFSYEDPNSAKDYSGRVRVSGHILPGVHVAIATSLLYGRGFSPGTAPTKDSFEWRDLNEDGRVLPSELIPIPGSSGRASSNFKRWGLGSDLQIRTTIPRLGESFIYGEVALAVNLDRAVAPADPILLGRDQRSLGFYVAAVQELTKHATVGFRFEQYEPNRDALELFDGMTVVTRRRFRTATFGVAGNLQTSQVARARLLAEVELQKNSLGRDNGGRPAQLDNDTLRLRLEIAF